MEFEVLGKVNCEKRGLRRRESKAGTNSAKALGERLLGLGCAACWSWLYAALCGSNSSGGPWLPLMP
jgi:hypothetical protein